MDFSAADFESKIQKNVSQNLVNEKTLYYYVGENYLGSDNFTNAGQIILINCNHSMIQNQNLSACTQAITLFYSNNNTLFNNTASDNIYTGIFLNRGSNNILDNIDVFLNNEGISLKVGYNNNLSSTHSYNNSKFGIYTSHN